MSSFSNFSSDIKQYLMVTTNYWVFTLTDGALRMLVVLHFHQLGYSPLQIAMLFLFYEFFGVVTNLLGGWLGAKLGLNKTMNTGLFLQIVALGLLLVPAHLLTVAWVMMAQAFSGIAKDLNKMSAKSSVKLLVADDAKDQLYHWVAVLTGSKNALKGAGFFLGGVLLTLVGFKLALIIMMSALCIIWLMSLMLLKKDLGKSKAKPKFSQLFSKSREINYLSAARLFLFGSRDIWFVIALPVYLATQFNWDHWQVGSFLASWIIGYGLVQAIAPKITNRNDSKTPDGKTATFWAFVLLLVIGFIAMAMWQNMYPEIILLTGLLIFGVVFAINSSLHSYLIVSLACRDSVSIDVGFYYMANAMGRLIGTILSGWIFQLYGLVGCLWASMIFVGATCMISSGMIAPKNKVNG
ncbi:MAG: organoarsenical effux MFS transporter ArsJ [Gammaproteobacteria bacterium]|nr:organoarsenical effux MFS transporter ArsJ [Gammaproteobacteria bacterium]